MSAGNGKGVRIEFDDENDNVGSGAAATGENILIIVAKELCRKVIPNVYIN